MAQSFATLVIGTTMTLDVRGSVKNSKLSANPYVVVEELVSNLAGREERMPTAALACFRLAIDHWRDLSDETAAELLHLWRPKEL